MAWVDLLSALGTAPELHELPGTLSLTATKYHTSMVAVKKQLTTGPEILHLNFGAMRIWRDDIAQMVSILQGATDKNLEFESDGFTLDSVSDLSDLPQESLTYFNATLKDESAPEWHNDESSYKIVLHLATDKSFLILKDPDNGMRWAASQIGDLLNRRQRRIYGAMKVTRVVALVMILLLAAPASFVIRGVLHPIINVSYVMLVFTALGLRFAIGRRLKSDRGTLIFKKTRAESPAFWQRKRDDITITIVSNVVSLGLGAWIGYMLSNL
ncbi:hypothetical protein [Micromonospora sp. NPDC004704]